MNGLNASNTVNLILLGKSGTGKSACGNKILGNKVFLSKSSSKPVTRDYDVEETVINGLNVRVIDTPDIFEDDPQKHASYKLAKKKCKDLCESDPCVYVVVMQVSRFTDGERGILRKLENVFGRKVKEQTIILFTHGDDLYRAGMTLEDFLEKCKPDLREIVKMCSNKYVLFENKNKGTNQRDDLMKTVNDMLPKNKQDVCLNKNVFQKWSKWMPKHEYEFKRKYSWSE